MFLAIESVDILSSEISEMASSGIPTREVGEFRPAVTEAAVLRLPDMNDESNLELYSKLLFFKNDLSRDEILWHHPENTLQGILQSLANRLNLEYEFSVGA